MKTNKILIILIYALTLSSCDCFLGFIGPECDEEEIINELAEINQDAEFNIIIQNVLTNNNSNQIPNNSNTIEVYFKLNNINQNPIPDKEESFFEIFEKGMSQIDFNLISENEALRKIDPDKAAFKYFNTIVLDLSGSVINNNLDQLKEATSNFVKNIYNEISAENLFTAIIWFDGTRQIKILQDFTIDQALLLSRIESINSNLPQDTSTNLNGAIMQSIQYLNSKLVSEQNSFIVGGSILFYTDGTDQAGHNSTQDAINSSNSARGKIDTYTIGLGNEIEESVLTQIGYSGAFFPENIEELQTQFATVANKIENEANSFYLLRYCSPKRNGNNELRIAVKGKNSSGGLAKFNANNFEDNCAID